MITSIKKKVILFRFDFKRKKNLSFGHLHIAKKIIDRVKDSFDIFYLIKTTINSNKSFKYLIKRNLIQKGGKLYLNNKLFKKKIDFLILDLPYQDKKLQLIKPIILNTIVIEDHFKNYRFADFYFTNLALNKKQLKMIYPYTKSIFYGNEYFVNNQLKHKKNLDKKIKNIFVNFGGSDPLNLTRKFLDKIQAASLANYTFHIVLGPGARKITYKSKFKNIKIYFNLKKKKFDDIRLNSDLAIVSGGNVLIENIFMGLPSLALGTSTYEKKIVNQLCKEKVIKKCKNNIFNDLKNEIDLLDYEMRTKMFRATKKMIKINKFFKILKSILNNSI